jgi:hypothetical protein
MDSFKPNKTDENHYNSLEDILNDPELAESFKPINKASDNINLDQRLIDGFEEINSFIDVHKTAPILTTSNMQELKLYSRLCSILTDESAISMLKIHDRHNILTTETHEANDDFVTHKAAEDIFTLKHVPYNTERASADFIARRKPCKNFAQYESLFKQCQTDLKSGRRKLETFSENKLEEKTYFIVNGVLGYLEKIYDLTKDPKHSKLDGRTYCIFENGTESNLLFRSLGKLLYDNGHIVSSTQEEADLKFNQGLNQQAHINDDDEHMGYIYVVKSKSNDAKISKINNLHKIGYCIGSIEDRIKNAANDPTFLLAPVEIVASYKCYNLNPQKLEAILHRIFKTHCLNIDVSGTDGKGYNPREWFILPSNIINQAINLIITEQITKYHYNSVTCSFELN